MPRDAPELERIERWMQAVITDPVSVKNGLEIPAIKKLVAADHLDDVILPSRQLTSLERLSIYSNMYFLRLIDILAEEFPTVQHLLGKSEFAKIARDYVTRHPSTHYSLARLGAGFPAYLNDQADEISESRFAAAIATVERAMEDVFDAQNIDPIRFDDLTSIPTEQWGDVFLRTIPALRLLQLDYPVNAFISAVRDNRHMDIPAAAPSFVAVYRQNYRVWRIDLDVQRFTLLSSLHDGQTLGSALEQCADLPDCDADNLMSAVGEWFREWTADGFFASAILDRSA